MKLIIAISAVIIFFASIIWAIRTKFGKETGVYINQEVKAETLMDSTYSVSTYVWYSHHWYDIGDIQWSAYNYSVKCYDVEAVKKQQYSQAIINADKLRKYINQFGGKICTP